MDIKTQMSLAGVALMLVISFFVGAKYGIDEFRQKQTQSCLEANPDIKYGEIFQYCKDRLYYKTEVATK